MGGVAVMVAALPLSGCAAMFGGYDIAPNGLPRDEARLREELAREPERAYTAVVEGEREVPDELLRLLYAGLAGRYAGQHAEACQLLDLAAYLAEDRVTTSVSDELAAMITSDRARDWTPSPTERLMLHYTAAAAYLEAARADDAAVEARRIEALLERAGLAGDGRDVPPDSRFLHLFTAAVFESAGFADAAEVSYRRAGFVRDTVTALPIAATNGSGTHPHRPREAGAGHGEVVVLVERGYVPHRVEQSVVVVLPAPQVAALTEGEAGERAAAAIEAAGRILLTANRYRGGRSGFYHDDGFTRPVRLAPWGCDERCEDTDADPYLLRISWPVLYQEPGWAAPLRVRAGQQLAEPSARFDVAAGVGRDFDADRAAMLARTVARAASKLALSAGAKEAVAGKDEAAGRLIGVLTNLGSMLLERADTRSWHLLPASIEMVRLRLPVGTHELVVEPGGAIGRLQPGDGPAGYGEGDFVELGPVQVEAGRTTVVTRRVWR